MNNVLSITFNNGASFSIKLSDEHLNELVTSLDNLYPNDCFISFRDSSAELLFRSVDARNDFRLKLNDFLYADKHPSDIVETVYNVILGRQPHARSWSIKLNW